MLDSVAKRRFQPLRVLIGILLMFAFALGTLAIMVRYAGGWGVPYFSFTTENGSRCTNTLTGYECQSMTLADVEFFGRVDLPDNTRVVSASYQSTHDYRLDALLDVPARSADAALYELNETFGKCGKQQPQPLAISGLEEELRHRQPDHRSGDRRAHQPALPDRNWSPRRRQARDLSGGPFPLTALAPGHPPRRGDGPGQARNRRRATTRSPPVGHIRCRAAPTRPAGQRAAVPST